MKVCYVLLKAIEGFLTQSFENSRNLKTVLRFIFDSKTTQPHNITISVVYVTNFFPDMALSGNFST